MFFKARHKQKISSKESEINAIKKDIVKVERAITNANESKTRLDMLEEKLKAAEK